MYFGSVRFFKHLILAIVALLIIVPVVVAVRLAVDNVAKEREISRLTRLTAQASSREEEKKEVTSEDRSLLSEDFLILMEAFGIEKEAFFQRLSELSEKDQKLLGKLNGVLKLSDAPTPADPETPAVPADPVIEEQPSSVPPMAKVPDTAPAPAAKVPDAKKVSDTTAPPVAKIPDAKIESVPAKSEPRVSGSDKLPAYASLYPDLYVENKAKPQYKDDKNYIYLTFDDGPSKNTYSILNYLKKNNVPATFFVIPTRNSRASLKQITDAGHAIGVHSASHEYKEIYASVEAFLNDFKKAYDMIYEQTGVKPYFFRFPGGSKNGHNAGVRSDIIAEMTRRGFVFFDWNVDSKDIDGANWTQMYNTVSKEVASNSAKTPPQRSMILFHDWNGGYNTVLVIDDVIKALKRDPRGYEFGKIDSNVRPLNFNN